MRVILINEKYKHNLIAYVKYDDKLGTVLDNLNKYRAPDNQITEVFNKYGQSIPLNYRIRGEELQVYYKN